MRKSFLLYLFVFTALMAVIIYANGKRIADSKDAEIEKLEQRLEESEDRGEALSSDLSSAQSFTLSSNEEALTYLEQNGLDPVEVRTMIEDELISRNRADADNDLVPYAGMEGHFRINNIKLLNHKWLLASFTDGKYWGDLFLTYQFDENGKLEVTTEEAVLYTEN
ncbi:hypothetical protein [Salinimicrobium flavum]|uniref:Hydrolase n=1 Tax=Salinimicrobium flavum TaxID=1737065 RepID=A0ABW5J0N5_9FLAO